MVHCGDCDEASGLYCGGKGTGVAGQCSACIPNETCESIEASNPGKNACGSLWNGCEQIHCGDCDGASGETCGGGGVANVCGVCVPNANACAGKNCGQVFNGCAWVSCGGDCAAGQECGANGVANVCGTCTPTTSCAAQGKTCGSLWNGCIMEQCGSCDSGEKCVQNGTQCCEPDTCSAHVGQCGDIPDGCGGNIQCGCPSSQTCVSGSCCTRLTCRDIAASVGGNPSTGCVPGPQVNFADDCGGIVQCEQCIVEPE
jgi:hypothetical protein